MGAPLSMDLRTRVVSSVEEKGMSRRAAAARFGVGIRTAVRWVAEFRSSGSVAPRKMGNPTPPKLSAHRETVLAPGGYAPASALVERFLHRPFTFDAWQRWLDEESKRRGAVGD